MFKFFFFFLTYGSSKFFHSWRNNRLYRKTVIQATCSNYKTVLQCPAFSHVITGAQYGPLWQHNTCPTCSKFHVMFVLVYPTQMSWQFPDSVFEFFCGLTNIHICSSKLEHWRQPCSIYYYYYYYYYYYTICMSPVTGISSWDFS